MKFHETTFLSTQTHEEYFLKDNLWIYYCQKVENTTYRFQLNHQVCLLYALKEYEISISWRHIGIFLYVWIQSAIQKVYWIGREVLVTWLIDFKVTQSFW